MLFRLQMKYIAHAMNVTHSYITAAECTFDQTSPVFGPAPWDALQNFFLLRELFVYLSKYFPYRTLHEIASASVHGEHSLKIPVFKFPLFSQVLQIIVYNMYVCILLLPQKMRLATSRAPKSLPLYSIGGYSYGCSNIKCRYIGKDWHWCRLDTC